MAYTSLHRSVGAPPGRVTAPMLTEAVALLVGEAEDLDWKMDLDETKNNREQAKDFAAMANARGGIIVTGVEEDGADHAAELVGVTDERAKAMVASFRSLAIGLIRPHIPAFSVYSVPLTDSPGRSAVVVEVPRSTEAPHLVAWDKESWRYPKRVGTDTVWLGEADLEAAYGRRFALRHDAQSHLQRLHEELRPRLFSNGIEVWIVVTAVPTVSAPGETALPANPSVSDPIMANIMAALPARNLLSVYLRRTNPVVGLRRSIFTSHHPYKGKSSHVHIELHQDGSFGGALNGNVRTGNDGALLSQLDLESGVRSLVTAAVLNAAARGADGTLQLHAQLVSNGPVALAEREDTHFERIDGGLTLDFSIPGQAPSSVTIEASLNDLEASGERRDDIANQLLLDLTHQFAVPNLLLTD
ncbi:ATP-binding protein (plasmid) [Streptomyces sp. NBC_01281]|uniref:AlbA family DNA-binding domain-containing protein n=1 Tax=Streptomyces sp. NBC_01281 TaxID=2903811 RepID=UPI002E15F040|nr:ATP-binding protein [Streptomyces sp. NBC_01281]WSK66605.1 ATP-binding protein [Streptomyces sp. NBC_01281]